MQKPDFSRILLNRFSPLKSLLLVLVLLLLGLMVGQLQQEFSQQKSFQEQRSYDLAAQIAGQVSLDLELQVQGIAELLRATALRPEPNDINSRTLHNLQQGIPNLQSLVWLNKQGGLIADTGSDGSDRPYLAALAAKSAGRPYLAGLNANPDSPLYILLRQPEGVRPGGFWVARLDIRALQQLLDPYRRDDVYWQLHDPLSQRVIAQHPQPMPDASNLQSIRLVELQRGDWQLRTLLDTQALRSQLLPELMGKLLLFALCGMLTLISLFTLLREQRRLREAHKSSRRELQRADTALRAIEERVILSDTNGLISYINPKAAQLLGVSSQQASGRSLLEMLPGFVASDLLHAPQQEHLVELVEHGQRRIFSTSCSPLVDDAEQSGNVWVLRDVTAEQRARKGLEQTRQRYQEIFESTGSGLCVMDLSDLRKYLLQQGLHNSKQLDQWLQDQPDLQDQLLQRMRITEVNLTTQRLLDVESAEQAWALLINTSALRPGGIRYRIIRGLMEAPQSLELEARVLNSAGQERFLWLMLRIPEATQDLRSLTLSLNDITSRKQMELALIERERFWSDLAQAVPDTLYVHDIPGKRLMFSNNHLGPDLGYSKAELIEMGNRMWEMILHPDDVELYQKVRNMQQVLGEGEVIQLQLRWRHRNGSWHWFEIREHAMARDNHGRVSRLIGVAKDVTEQLAASHALRESESRYRLLAESTTDIIFSTDARLKLNYVSPASQNMLGYSPDWIMRNGFFELAANPEQMTGILKLLEKIYSALGDAKAMAQLNQLLPTQLFVFDCMRADGRQIPAELHLSMMWDDKGSFEGLHGVGRDISLQRRADKQLRMAATVFDQSTAAILVTDPLGYIVQVNDAFSRLTGYSTEDVIDQQPTMLMNDQQQIEQARFVMAQLEKSHKWEGEIWFKRKNGESYPVWLGATATYDSDGDLVSYVCFFSDISERKASEQRIHRLAYYDALTLLPNRTLFQDRLHTALQHAEKHAEWVVLMFLDLDRFKPINDSLGHAAGDRMLKEVANRLSECVEEYDTAARMGGDEFTLLLAPTKTRESALNRAISVAESILNKLHQVFVLDGREFFISASIGIAFGPQDGSEISQLMKNADTAMYHAKEKGKDNFQFYQADMNARALERLELESDLRHALEQNEFVLYYQPQFSGDGLRLTGAEALLRWQHPQRGLVPPIAFIPVLEELGLINEVGDWVLAEACRQLSAWQAAGLVLPKISINLSARQFKDGLLAKRIAAILARHNIPAASLELELTESILMGNVEQALQTLSELKKLGLCIAVDDFGTGYSSLNYLKQFPIDVLKIDRSFVDGLPDGEQDAQIARAIIAMAHSLNLAVIAEGVETREQLEFLREHACDEVQGYLLGRPMPAAELAAQFTGKSQFSLS